MTFTAVEATLDDLMRVTLSHILDAGQMNVATKGANKEIVGVMLELTQPRARLSRTETRGKVFSCLGELCWYLRGTDALAPIAYYVKRYEADATGDRIIGAYGPRLFDAGNQIPTMIDLLKRKPSTRQAVVQLFDGNDLKVEGTSVPCTCTLQFLLRDEKLSLVVNMRSNDAHLGLPHDVFCFTMLQELVAATLDCQLGTYVHTVGSLHLYDTSVPAARSYLAEGWQPTTSPMPVMPHDNPWPEVENLLSIEQALREGEASAALGLPPGYWSDLARLLGAFRARKTRDTETSAIIRAEMTSRVFDAYLYA